jgi:acetyl-CoA carboxylase biotin carboxyl carrier protein
VEIKHIKELMAVMGRTGTKKLTLKKEGFELQLEQHESGKTVESYLEAGDELTAKSDAALNRASLVLSKGRESAAPVSGMIPAEERQEETAGVYVTSPMVGTFYETPSPDDPPFVKVGDKIEKHTVVCIIEAMKVMNEVKAGVSGTVAEILVENGHPVEFGTKLFRII